MAKLALLCRSAARMCARESRRRFMAVDVHGVMTEYEDVEHGVRPAASMLGTSVTRVWSEYLWMATYPHLAVHA